MVTAGALQLPGAYRLIGRCYLDGLMKGEAFYWDEADINDIWIA